MNTAVKYLLIDIGEVLILKTKTPTYTELLAEELKVPVDLAQEINKLHYTTMETKHIPEGEFVARLAREVGYAAPENIYDYFERAYIKQTRPNVAFLDYLEEVRALGIRTAVLSNTTSIYQRVQEQSGITEDAGFSPIFYSWRVEMRKPDKEIFKLALDELGEQPEEVIFIDDKEEHLAGARSVGMKTIQFDDTDNVITKIKEAIKAKV